MIKNGNIVIVKDVKEPDAYERVAHRIVGHVGKVYNLNSRMSGGFRCYIEFDNFMEIEEKRIINEMIEKGYVYFRNVFLDKFEEADRDKNISKNTIVKITDIFQEDLYYLNRQELIGFNAKVVYMESSGNHFFGKVRMKEGPLTGQLITLIKAKIELPNGKLPEKFSPNSLVLNKNLDRRIRYE